MDGITIPAALLIRGKQSSRPFAIISQIHGNEPAGLAGILLAAALSEAGLLERDIIAVIGNPLAAQQYFKAWHQAPEARQETRDAFRCGVSPEGDLLPDMNRIPVDFETRNDNTAHTLRARELYAMGQRVWGVLDIHTARGNMVCITDHKRDADLKRSPIRSLLVDLAEAISANASNTVTVQTLKTILSPLPNIESQTGIEAGRHEAPESPHTAASFTLSTLHTLGLTRVAPLYGEEHGSFIGYRVRPRITYADLEHGKLQTGDKVYMVKACTTTNEIPERSEEIVVRTASGYTIQATEAFAAKPQGELVYALYQYDEMEPIAKDAVVALALPSGTEFRTREKFSGIFVSKSAKLYDKDPAVGPWPVQADAIDKIKFCYPCDVSEITLF